MTYPNTIELEIVRRWPPDDLHGMMGYVYNLWHMAEWGWKKSGDEYSISTGGWSGNEDLIGAMMDNEVWWAQFLASERRGGHYVFNSIEHGRRVT